MYCFYRFYLFIKKLIEVDNLSTYIESKRFSLQVVPLFIGVHHLIDLLSRTETFLVATPRSPAGSSILLRRSRVSVFTIHIVFVFRKRFRLELGCPLEKKKRSRDANHRPLAPCVVNNPTRPRRPTKDITLYRRNVSIKCRFFVDKLSVSNLLRYYRRSLVIWTFSSGVYLLQMVGRFE